MKKPKGLTHLARLLVDHGLSRDHLHTSGQHACDRALHLRLVGPWLGDDVDVVELAHIAEQRLRGRDVERGQRRTGQVVRRAEARETGDGEGPRRALQQDPDPLTHLEVVLLRGAEIHDHVVRRRRTRPLGQVERGDLLVRVERDAERRGSAGCDRLAVMGDVLRVAGDRTRCRLDAGDGAHASTRATPGRDSWWRCHHYRTARHRGPGNRCSGRCSRRAC